MKTWIVIIAFAGTLALGFSSGLLVGRQFPAKHFERFGTSMYLYEVSTGKMCDPFPAPNPFEQFGGTAFQPAPTASTNPYAEFKTPQSSPPPPCVK